MIILGLHFGHDASVSIIQDGIVIVTLIAERHERVKHCISLHPNLILKAIETANIKIDRIDYCAITSTQYYEIILLEPNIFDINLTYLPEYKLGSTIANQLESLEYNFDTAFGEIILPTIFSEDCQDNLTNPEYPYISGKPKHEFQECFPYAKGSIKSEFKTLKWLNYYTPNHEWIEGDLTLDNIQKISLKSFLKKEKAKQGFHYPVTVRLLGYEIPSYFINHHASHAASAYFQSNYNCAAILTHDGLHREQSGLFWLGLDREIFPLTPHFMEIGMLYRCASMSLGLGWTDGPGKMMGLAPYGNPLFFDRKFVGNYFDYLAFSTNNQVVDWLNHCLSEAIKNGYDTNKLGKQACATDPINADIAASTQKLCEEIILKACHTFSRMLHSFKINTSNLCLSGGVMLNCPSNTRIWKETDFSHIFIEPACDDSGLSVGAALWLYHNLLNKRKLKNNTLPYLGLSCKTEELADTLQDFGNEINYSILKNPAQMAAVDINNNTIIGWFEERSEIGPRALGHRSILANPRYKENRDRVNLIKERENWRPLAPSVLASEASSWFTQVPLPSPYMLFTAKVISSEIPAVTHVNDTARIQTVDESCGEFYRLLLHLHQLNGCPIVLNTSLNRRGEPIVETPAHAIDLFLNTKLDALYIKNYRITKK
ncbi:carbamoyltransferase C-terminal domain-containing protein [Roseofilum casamattae]|uniref:Carbamoyltransferase C-terminal domain-containing protein n=1 Tax=Roseofilum casamattae BLCC-M143 TaxID=3022442 RepID=A0ABT7BWR2_9CYAN|nr:carbamoyltransferase C-terminal domain-containing protein [Roseofilum casamattae]MDJ1182901.1 carbamoyltransferase C-terminal domain-containing protein [Roseofilum casamattae BLCC-M143]